MYVIQPIYVEKPTSPQIRNQHSLTLARDDTNNWRQDGLELNQPGDLFLNTSPINT